METNAGALAGASEDKDTSEDEGATGNAWGKGAAGNGCWGSSEAFGCGEDKDHGWGGGGEGKSDDEE